MLLSILGSKQGRRNPTGNHSNFSVRMRYIVYHRHMSCMTHDLCLGVPHSLWVPKRSKGISWHHVLLQESKQTTAQGSTDNPPSVERRDTGCKVPLATLFPLVLKRKSPKAYKTLRLEESMLCVFSWGDLANICSCQMAAMQTRDNYTQV